MKINTFEVSANLPKDLEPLRDLASNLWFCWNYQAIELFRQLDADKWDQVIHGPKHLLDIVSQERFEEVLKDESFIAYMLNVHKNFKDYFKEENWFCTNYKDLCKKISGVIAYFSMEYGLDESIPIYSGGLGILSGDHLKAASDIGLPLVAVGLAYQKGYFKQSLSNDGWQKELYPHNDFIHMPFALQLDDNNQPIIIEVDNGNNKIYAQIWRCDVGRIPLYLLDTNIEKNSPENRSITSQLYGGGTDLRILQELLLGIGGIRALEVLGVNPAVCHMNEGHAAFLSLARIQSAMKHYSISKEEAMELVKATNVFTTHTPVSAGNDRFEVGKVYTVLEGLLKEIGLSADEFFALGRENAQDTTELFCMTVLALKMSSYANGVSELHGHVSRNMWKNVWPNLTIPEIPIKHITNGVHVRTWISHDLADLYNLYISPKWGRDPLDKEQRWQRVDRIPDLELWGTHERRRERLVSYARKKLVEQAVQRGASLPEIERANEALNSKALTIGFAKRFATYKRANLIFKDIERLKEILLDKDRPVQLIFAGKAHPMDNPGKKFIQMIEHYARQDDLRNNIVFLEDYDITVGRYLVQGCDVWLNNPRRPLEASGTSGMKASVNGVLNLSILDGWWCEGYNGKNGWAIGKGEEYGDQELQDNIEGDVLYNILEKEVVPLFYERGVDGLPRLWISKMKECIKSIAPIFSTTRMVSDYTNNFYVPALRTNIKLEGNNCEPLRKFSAWKNSVKTNWHKLNIAQININIEGALKVGDEVVVDAKVKLDSLSPDDVSIQLYYGTLNNEKLIEAYETIEMSLDKKDSHDNYRYSAKINCTKAGIYGYTVRILSKHEFMANPYEPGLITWAT